MSVGGRWFDLQQRKSDEGNTFDRFQMVQVDSVEQMLGIFFRYLVQVLFLAWSDLLHRTESSLNWLTVYQDGSTQFLHVLYKTSFCCNKVHKIYLQYAMLN